MPQTEANGLNLSRATATAEPCRSSKPLLAPNMGDGADDEERSEYVVCVEWIRSVPKERAFWEKGLFAHQRTVLPMRDQETLTRLVEHFNVSEASEQRIV
jgi:hypothetical protein